MRNYVIINGVNSLTIQGLAIKTLPPITKPIQRNLREEIDGRDGDIVTTLGYGAYDKTIEIGLFGTFDIDEVIAYFNQKGTITFSNEADKVYYFEALDQVDYAELLKFRTANVVLHCQPFKYPLNETPLVEEYEYVEATGTNVTLDNTSEAIFNKIDLLGNTEQTQYTGKNLFNINLKPSSAIAYDNGFTLLKPANRTITINLPTTYSAGNYVVSFKTTNSNLTDYPKLGVWLQHTQNGNIKDGYDNANHTITLNAGGEFNKIYFLINNDQTDGATITIYDIQLQTGTQKTDYEPYVGGIPSPNPNYPQDIHVVSGDNTIEIKGRNFLDLTNGIATGSNSGITMVKQNDNTYSFVGTATSITPNIWVLGSYGNWYNYSDYASYDKTKILLTLEPNTYTIKDMALFYIYEDGTKSNVAPTIGNKSTITLQKRAHIVAVRAPVMVNGETYNTILYPQLELGSIANPYEKGVTQSFPISLGNLEMASIPNTDYKDVFVKEGDTWYKRGIIGYNIMNGTEAGWNYNTPVAGVNRFYKGINGIYQYTDTNRHIDKIRANYFYPSTNNAIGATFQYMTQVFFHMDANTYTDINDWKTWLGTHNLKLYFVKAEAEDVEITNTTLIDQLEAIKNAISYNGQTNISQTNNDMPFILDLSALKENSDHLVIDNIGNIYSKPTLDLEGTGIVDIYLNDTQMFEVDLSEKNEIVIDTEKMEAYNPTDNTLANRQVTGDYSKFKLDSGENDLRFSGDLTKATITNYERWL